MRAEISAYFTPEDEDQLESILDGICDVLRDHGLAAPAQPSEDDEIASLVVVRPTEGAEDSEKWLEDIVEGAFKVAIPSRPFEERRDAIVVPIGIASESNVTENG